MEIRVFFHQAVHPDGGRRLSRLARFEARVSEGHAKVPLMNFAFTTTNQQEFLFGLLVNVVSLQVWAARVAMRTSEDAGIRETGERITDTPEGKRILAEHVVDYVIRRFHGPTARRDMESMRDQLVDLAIMGMSDPSTPEPHLKLVR
jgi:hypothetical protein